MSTYNRVVFDKRIGGDWIRVVDLFPLQHRYLHFEHSIQGVMSLLDHTVPVLEYVGLMCYAVRELAHHPPRVLIGGLGSCTALHFIDRLWRHTSDIVTVEINPAVIDLGRRFFRLTRQHQVVEDDLRAVLEGGASSVRVPAPWDLVIVDCYSSQFVPASLMSVEFMELVRTRTAPDGLAVFNLWSPNCNRICGHQVRTILEVFETVAVLHCREDDNLLLFASPQRHFPWPTKVYFKGLRYPFAVYQKRFESFWPGFLRDSSVIDDAGADRYLQHQNEIFETP
ncbi:spermidine synthase [Acanthopleuribacter pedis]|uniref:Fused MFS/spermidine synthase n=1 Tax=Acanthopleuribacter pedis TaxID=442870 RepID=A0A8J7U5S0_9BACT|nr:fused MFS/spermidine synthase [Acanthopleuribacter pedis]MBO1322007.1 fused MFS/spermidine synthase [Acanthopleuribacter pedis]